MTRASLIALIPLVALAACGSPSREADDTDVMGVTESALLGTATLSRADGTPIGTAELTGSGDAVTISVVLSGLEEGVRAVHLHTAGTCDAPDFESAGPHLNPNMQEHGVLNPAGPHLGDLPNAMIDADGDGTVTATLLGTRDEVLAAIFDDDGTAIIVHEGEDDYVTDPTGNAGGRVACGVFVQA